MLEIRRLTRADIDAAAELTGRVFGNAADVAQLIEQNRAANLHCLLMPPELCWGMFDAGRLVAKWQLIDLTVRVLGAQMRVAGAHAVAAEPAYRGLEVVRRLAEAGYQDVQAEGFDLMLGFAQRGSIYQRLGGRPVCAESLWELDALRVPAPRSNTLRSYREADLPWLIDTYNQENAARSGSLVRTPLLWSFLPRRPPEVRISSAGYVGLRREGEGLEVREIAARSDDFYDAALRELAEDARAAGVRRVFGHVPADHPLVLTSIPYGARTSVQYERHSGCMAGIVDAQRFLDKLSPALGDNLRRSRFADTRVNLSLHLPGKSWSCLLNANGARNATLALALTQGDLVQLAFGYLQPRVALAQAALETGAAAPPVLDGADLALLQAMFAQPIPFVWATDRF